MARQDIHLVLKLSKYCNLRCDYCYEFDHLGERARMPLELLERIFRLTADFAAAGGLAQVNFVWHGGEPFMIPVSLYRRLHEAQKAAFDGGLRARNSVQTNLNILPDALLAYLESGEFFDSIGVSFDVHGDQRVDARGRPSTRKVLDNLQRLLTRGIGVGAITVLARNTLPHVRAIVDFYDRLDMPFRFLPFYLSASDRQAERHAIGQDEFVEAMRLTFDLWLGSTNAPRIDPVADHVGYAAAFLTGRRGVVYDMTEDENVFIVDLDGTVFGSADIYDPKRAYGSFAELDIRAVLDSPSRLRALEECAARVARYCDPCPYFGFCPGKFVADASPAQRAAMASGGCPVRDIIDHIVGRLRETGLAEDFLAKTAPHGFDKPMPIIPL